MSDFSDRAQAVLNIARAVDDPSDVDRDRIEAGLAVKLGASALAGSGIVATQVVSAASAAGTVGTLAGAKLFVVVASIIVAASAAGTLTWRARSRSPRVASAAPVIVARTAPPVVTARRVPETSQEAQPAGSDALAAESSALLQAREALVHGAPERSLAILDRAGADFPNGFLREERDLARIEALCGLHHDEQARSAAASFEHDHPGSALIPRVRTACVPERPGR